MKLILFLIKASWQVVLLASLIGALSGVASIALVAFILHALRQPEVSSTLVAASFAGLCAVSLATRIGSQVILCRLTQTTVSRLRMRLCRRILEAPLGQLEEIGMHRMFNALTGDVITVTQAMNGVPSLTVSFVILLGGTVYLGWLSPKLMAAALAFCLLGMASYWKATAFARRFVRRTREMQDVLIKQLRTMIDGVKELKMHHDRRRTFLDNVLEPAEEQRSRNRFLCDTLFDGAVACGRLLFFVAIGLLLFAWPRYFPVDSVTLTGYVLTILYLMSPVEQIMAWVPFMAHASVAVRHIERMGFLLDQVETESEALVPVDGWRQIDLCDVTRAYRREGKPAGFLLGPISLTLRPGEIVFIVGGNGSGKTTLGKLITGLYTPETGEVRLDGQAVGAHNRESYRQLFSVVFDDAVVFDSLWGLEAANLDERAGEYLRQLELDHVVSVAEGAFSTTQLSRGQRKRLALLTAYLEDRPIYLFDEWAADQDPVFRKVFYLRLLPELKRRGKAVIAITHDDRYFDSADWVVRLEEGRIVESPFQDALEAPRSETT